MGRERAMSEAHIDLTGCKILIVDDVPANLDVLVQALDHEGYNILVASDGMGALGVTVNARPDLILLDVMMPGIDGYETCRRLKEAAGTATIPVIFLTARDDLEGVIEGFEAGGLDYIVKPFKKEEVLMRVKTHLERTVLARELAALNAQLEQKVEDRTFELRQKVRELEGKDRITQHLLRFHSLEETLGLVLAVVSDILGLTKVVIYLRSEADWKPAAAMGIVEAGRIAEAGQLSGLKPSASHQEAFDRVEQTHKAVTIALSQDEAQVPFAVVPILRGNTLLGLIEVADAGGGRTIDHADLETLASFALQAAVAINDAQVRQDPGAWEDQLEEVLEIGEELGDADNFDALQRGLGNSQPDASA